MKVLSPPPPSSEAHETCGDWTESGGNDEHSQSEMNRRSGNLAAMPEPVNGASRKNGKLRDIDLELIDDLPVGMALIELCTPSDSRTWRLTTANATARRVMGDASLLDFLLNRLTPFPFKKNMESLYQQILQRRRPKELRAIVTDIGRVRRTYSVIAFSVPPRHIGVLMQDESILAEAQKALLEQKNIHAEVSRAIKSFLWRGDPATLNTIWVSPDAQEILGYWPEHWINFPNFWVAHIHAEDREKVAKLVNQCNSQELRFDYRIHAADGTEKWLHAVIRRTETLYGVPELAGVMVDITGRKLAEEQAHDLSGQLLQAQDEERRRVARELHDSLGQYISLLGLNVGRLSRTVPGLNEEQRELFAETTELVETCCQEVRTMSYLMHPPMLDEVGLGPALDWFVKGFSERSGIQVEIHGHEDVKQLPKRVEMAFFRIAQAGLTNVYRHSGSSKAEVNLRRDGDGVMLEIVDYGHGFVQGKPQGDELGEAKGVGIRGMRERMRELGGVLEVISGASGTVVRARVTNKSKAFAAGG